MTLLLTSKYNNDLKNRVIVYNYVAKIVVNEFIAYWVDFSNCVDPISWGRMCCHSTVVTRMLQEIHLLRWWFKNPCVNKCNWIVCVQCNQNVCRQQVQTVYLLWGRRAKSAWTLVTDVHTTLMYIFSPRHAHLLSRSGYLELLIHHCHVWLCFLGQWTRPHWSFIWFPLGGDGDLSDGIGYWYITFLTLIYIWSLDPVGLLTLINMRLFMYCLLDIGDPTMHTVHVELCQPYWSWSHANPIRVLETWVVQNVVAILVLVFDFIYIYIHMYISDQISWSINIYFCYTNCILRTRYICTIFMLCNALFSSIHHLDAWLCVSWK